MTQEMNPTATVAGESVQPEAIAAAPELAPVAESQRIDVLDVLRGFALIGILMMNIEWFNKPIAVLTMPDYALAGLDHASGAFTKLFVEGKFYKLFSLLFGMGFAVMLLRAESLQRPFYGWFTRRAVALFAFGMAHSILMWTGDILHDYAFAAMMLLGVVWLRRGGPGGSFFWAFFVPTAFGAAASAWFWNPGGVIGGAVAGVVGMLMIHLRRKDKFAGLRDPRGILKLAIILALPPIVLPSLGVAWQSLSDDPVEARARFDKSEAKRHELEAAWPAREKALLAEAVLVAPGDIGVLPSERRAEQEKAEEEAKLASKADADKKAGADKTADADKKKPADSAASPGGKDKAEGDKAKKDETTAAERFYQGREDRAVLMAWETRAMTDSNYLTATRWRWRESMDSVWGAPMFALGLLHVFLFGWWLIESGVVRRAEAHLSFFRHITLIGWVFGFAFAVVGVRLTYMAVWQFAPGPGDIRHITMWCGQLLLCAAYLGTFVLLLRKQFWRRALGWLAPLGRMALTNYLTHSLVFSTLFYGYGAGLFGQVPRFQQMGFVAAMILSQAVFSRIWLANFNYGPMEWLWRSATYLKWQPLRRAA